MNYYNCRKVLVTGGASFIGSYLVDALVEMGAEVRVADDLSSGKLENIHGHIHSGAVEFLQYDLRNPKWAREACAGIEMVFHLAAAHGGRGYVDTHQVECGLNYALDATVFKAAEVMDVQNIVFASSACVYPMHLLNDPDEVLLLKEEQVGPPYEPDNAYGWAKLMSERLLVDLHRERGIGTASCRLFHVYGPRAVENHALVAMIARCFLKKSPFEVWGTGQQIRNWTHVYDTVNGLLKAGQYITDGTAINICTEDRIRVIDAVRHVLEITGHEAEIVTKPDAPTGPYNRAGSNRLARKLLNWWPVVSFDAGVRDLVAWYYRNRTASDLQNFDRMLTER